MPTDPVRAGSWPMKESRLVETKSEDAPWWLSSPHLDGSMRKLFSTYVDLEDDEILGHIRLHREKAWQIRPYPCIGMFAFLKSNIKWSEIDNEYSQILARVKQGFTLLDIGCAMGQDLRYLAADGAPTENMFASDLIPDFWNLSYELFKDAHKMNGHFIHADIFEASSELGDLNQSVDIIVAGDFLHLFNWPAQVRACCQIVKLSRPQTGTIIIGKQIGRQTGRPVPTKWGNKDVMYMHDTTTFRSMWNEVETLTGTKWIMKIRVASFGEGGYWSPKEDFAWMAEDAVGLQFVLVREE